MNSHHYLAAPLVVTAAAEIDAANASQLRTALLAVDGRCPAVVVNMSRTAFCDMAGIGVLVQARHRARADGGEVRLVITSVPVLRMFALTGRDYLFPIFTSLADALADGSGPPAAPQQMKTR
jgi:anti-sigma B factor antagonist